MQCTVQHCIDLHWIETELHWTDVDAIEQTSKLKLSLDYFALNYTDNTRYCTLNRNEPYCNAMECSVMQSTTMQYNTMQYNYNTLESDTVHVHSRPFEWTTPDVPVPPERPREFSQHIPHGFGFMYDENQCNSLSFCGGINISSRQTMTHLSTQLLSTTQILWNKSKVSQ